MQQPLAVPTARILVADDDPDMRALVTLALRRDGYQVVEAACGAEALERLSNPEATIDAVVSDVRMPSLGGLEVVVAIRRAGLALPVVLITAFGDEELHAEARRLGATAVLDKPFDLDDLRTVMMNLVPLR